MIKKANGAAPPVPFLFCELSTTFPKSTKPKSSTHKAATDKKQPLLSLLAIVKVILLPNKKEGTTILLY